MCPRMNTNNRRALKAYRHLQRAVVLKLIGCHRKPAQRTNPASIRKVVWVAAFPFCIFPKKQNRQRDNRSHLSFRTGEIKQDDSAKHRFHLSEEQNYRNYPLHSYFCLFIFPFWRLSLGFPLYPRATAC